MATLADERVQLKSESKENGVLKANSQLESGDSSPSDGSGSGGGPPAKKQKVDKDGASFLVFGDWGGLAWEPFFTKGQQAVATEMNKVSLEIGAEAVISVGDHFYLTGVESVDDPRWKQTFEDVYTGVGLQIPWFALPGNHDYDGSELAQVEYTKLSDRWTMPSLYHSKVVNIDADHTALLIFLDTNAISSFQSYTGSDAAQREWLIKLLENSDDDAIFMFGHHPVYSNGWNHGPTRWLGDPHMSGTISIPELMEKYQVSAYFAGHDHQLEHLQLPDSKLDFFVSGAGSAVTPERKFQQRAKQKFMWTSNLAALPTIYNRQYQTEGGFMSLHITADKWTVKAHTVPSPAAASDVFATGVAYTYEKSLPRRRKSDVEAHDCSEEDSRPTRFHDACEMV